MQLTKNDMFHTPKSMDELHDWIMKHSPETRPHLITVMEMTWNFLAQELEKEQGEEESQAAKELREAIKDEDGKAAKELYAAIKEETAASYDELNSFASFNEFFDQVDIDNAYEESWNECKHIYRVFYQKVFEELKKEQGEA